MNHDEAEIDARATRIIEEAHAMDPDQRAALFESRCATDPILYARVQARLGRSPATPSDSCPTSAHDSPAAPTGAAQAQRETIAQGTVIGPYTIDRMLGSGGFGTVYLATQSEPVRREVALKIIKLGMDTEEIVRRFEAERQALAQMSHPGVAQVFDAGVTDRGRPYFVMEYVPGVSIARYCDTNRLSTRERVRLFIDVCHAIQHAHQKGIIHRDLKPSNIMVTMVDGSPQPKIIDFGIAKAIYDPLGTATLVTQAGQAIGTPEYMSPEQAQTEGRDVDTRTDVYSLGMVLYELLTGSLPHTLAQDQRPSLIELRQWVIDGETIRPSTRIGMLGDAAENICEHRNTTPNGLRRELRGELEWITLKALERDRVRRYGSVFALADDLQRLLRNDPVSAGPPTATYRTRKFIARHRGGVLASLAMSGALIIGTGLAVAGLISARDAAQVAQSAERQTAQALAETKAQKHQAELSLIKAEQETVRAREVRDFLVRVLTSVDPGVAGPTVRMIDVLQMAEVDLAHDSFSDPISNATIHGALGESYKALAQFDQATEHLDARVEAFTDLFGAQDVRTLRAKLAAGANRRELAQYDQARAILEPTHETLERLNGPNDPDTIAALSHIGRLELQTGNYEASERIFRDALARLEENGAGPKSIASAQTDVGWALMEQNKLNEAETIFRGAQQALLESVGQTHPTTLRARDTLAITLQKLGRMDEAIKIYEDVLRLRREQVGEENPLTLWAMNNLGSALNGVPGRTEEAREMTERVLELQRKRFGNQHLYTVTTMNNLASIYRRLGRLDEADQLWREVITQGTELWGENHPRTLAAISNRATLLSDMDRLQESRDLFEYALPRMEEAVGRQHGMWLASKNGLGALLIKMEDYQAALACFDELIPEAEAALPPGHWYIHQFQSWRGMALIGLGRGEEAAPVLEDALAGLAAQFGKQHHRVLGVREKLLNLYDSLGREEDIARILSEYPDGSEQDD
jgi:eukaryotic-like serine/threonine-protein kinase